ncbi:RnfH family protein [Pseudomonas putida]|nr:RnfH family protein [Pseudomonas putida]
MAEPLINIEVAYAAVDDQALIALQVPVGTCVAQAIELSGIAERFPEVDFSHCPVGIFSSLLASPAEHVLRAGERIELYRPLLADPKEVRRLRAAKAAQTRKVR